jgi:hypothetical protein
LKWIRSLAVLLFLLALHTAAYERNCTLSCTVSLTFQSIWFILINAQ